MERVDLILIQEEVMKRRIKRTNPFARSLASPLHRLRVVKAKKGIRSVGVPGEVPPVRLVVTDPNVIAEAQKILERTIGNVDHGDSTSAPLLSADNKVEAKDHLVGSPDRPPRKYR